METLEKVKSGYEGLMSSMSELGALNVSYMEKMAENQIDSAKYATELGFDHIKSLTKIDSFDAVKSLPASTMELSSKLARKTIEDAKAYMEFGSSYKSDVTDIFKKAKDKAV